MKVGDIIVYVYHYNARYPEFARVTKATDKSVWLEKLGKKWLSHDGYGQNGYRVPDFDAPAKSFNRCFRIKKRPNGEEWVKVDTYCYGCLWDGKPEDEYTD